MEWRSMFGGAVVMALGAGWAAVLDPETGTGLMEGKVRTDRTIEIEIVVEAPPAEVFRLWSTAEGVQQFFAPGARIDSRPGGRYEIFFAPDQDPLGYSHGTTGARLLRSVKDRELAFEWITFAGDDLLGLNAPPVAPRALRDMRPLPTWVELSFEAVPSGAGRTRVLFRHYGFRSGGQWDASFEWFHRAWAGVLAQLAGYCRSKS